MVTAIIAPPISMPFPCAVMPPAWESPDWETKGSEEEKAKQKPHSAPLTGTKNNTPVTMDVNAVPPILLE